MKRTIRLDQASAWILALIIACGCFGLFYGLTRRAAQEELKQEENIGAESTSKDTSEAHDADGATGQDDEKDNADKPDKAATAEKADKSETQDKPERETAPDKDRKEDEDKDSKERESEPEKHSSVNLDQGPPPDIDLGAKWSYAGSNGPEFWGSLSGLYEACKTGRQQSPVDLGKSVTGRKLESLRFSYQSSIVSLANNGKAIEVRVSPGNILTWKGIDYEMVSGIFHLPSEHTLNGVPYDMELELEHRNSGGQSLMMSILMSEGGPSNKALQTLWRELPSRAGDQSAERSFNLATLLPEKRAYYSYQGSQTVPPCQEDVRWFVLKQAVGISSAQIDRFVALYRNNARPTQPLLGREVLLSVR